MNQGFWEKADVIGGLHARSEDFLFAGFNNVFDLQINNRADGEVAAGFIRQVSVFFFDEARGAGPEVDVSREIFFRKQAGVEAVIEIVAVISDFVGEIGDLGFERGVFGVEISALAGVVESSVMLDEAFADFPTEIQAGEIGIFLFEFLNDAKTVAIVLEAAVFSHEFVQNSFALVAEGRMAEVMGEGDGFGEVFVELERAGDVPRNGGNLHGVREARAEVITGAVEENLGFIFEAAKGAGMDHAVAVALVLGAPLGRGFVIFAAASVGAELRVGREDFALDLFEFNARARHGRRVKKPRMKSTRGDVLDETSETTRGTRVLRFFFGEGSAISY